jgi:hypothetical protein
LTLLEGIPFKDLTDCRAMKTRKLLMNIFCEAFWVRIVDKDRHTVDLPEVSVTKVN